MGWSRRWFFALAVATVFIIFFTVFLGWLGPASPSRGPALVGRRRLIGPGSSPPTCRSKCGQCTPCRAVHVPIQPGLTVPLEYYPEAWRCKCGNKLYMP